MKDKIGRILMRKGCPGPSNQAIAAEQPPESSLWLYECACEVYPRARLVVCTPIQPAHARACAGFSHVRARPPASSCCHQGRLERLNRLHHVHLIMVYELSSPIVLGSLQGLQKGLKGHQKGLKKASKKGLK